VCNGSIELGRENAITVMDEKAVAMIRWDGFSQLLQCPRCSGVRCDIAVYNPPGLVFDNNEHVEQPKRRRHDNTEVTGQYGRCMIANKGRPALIAMRLSTRALGHVLAYRAGSYPNPELEKQFIGNTFLTPRCVTRSHFMDECAQFRRYPWSPWS